MTPRSAPCRTGGWSGGWIAALALLVSVVPARGQDVFSHPEHEGLFPVCTGCHTGVGTEGLRDLDPPANQCAGCHDGVEQPTVDWRPSPPPLTTLAFGHPLHAVAVSEVEEAPVSCAECHSTGGGRMAVEERVREESCLGCHAEPGEDHLEDTNCALCHLPVATTELSLERRATFPVPSSHAAGGFVSATHGTTAPEATAQCATCHTQDRCAACHVDASLPAIAALPAAPAGMELPPAVAHYPVPETHASAGFLGNHAPPPSEGSASCSTCHTADDCAACHQEPVPSAVEQLPTRTTTSAPGVHLARIAPGTHESQFFMEGHGTLAASEPGSCAGCHAEATCVACHDGPSTGGYHPADFVARHAADAWGQSAECATCHDQVVFCRSCHQDAGLGSQGRLGPGYHDAQPVWLLRHGQAARQNLESCASCHEQRQCLQCHSTLGSFQVSPHGRDFDAAGAWARNPRTCLACHVGNPLEGSG